MLTIALTIGIYLITTTALISKDGAFYIECAQKLANNPSKMIKTTTLISKDGVLYFESGQKLANNPFKILKPVPPGYPLLIIMSHKCAALFTNDSSSVFTWIYSAQSVTLLCRLLALIPLYFIGKLLVGYKNSFWGLLILILLPYPAQFVCDIVRVWPYLLFLATGFYFLLWGAKYGKWWAFGLVGLSSGLGYLIRPECAQLLVYGFLWVVISMFRPKLWKVSRWKSIFALTLLFIGFAIPTAPYMKCTGRIMPQKLNHVINSFSFNSPPHEKNSPRDFDLNSDYNTAEIIPGNLLNAFSKLAQKIIENLMYFFAVPLVVGLYSYLRKKKKDFGTERFFVFAFIALNTLMLIVLDFYYDFISRRHCMAIVAFTIFFVPVGLEIIGQWLDHKRDDGSKKYVKTKRASWSVILLLIGIGICLPKLLTPNRTEKKYYKNVAKWLNENTSAKDYIASHDRRLFFYAGRSGMVYSEKYKISKHSDYIVKLIKKQDEGPEISQNVEETYSRWVDKKKGKKLVIYKVIR